jgi:hypothetical protein
MNRRWICTLVLVALLAPGAARAEPPKATGKSPPPATHKVKGGSESSAPPAPSSQAVPDGHTISILVRRTLLTLNDANLSGNYTVLRDLSAPGFQAANNAAKLAEIFVVLRNRGIDLAPVMFFDPKLVRDPEIGPNGMLRVSGFIPSKPEQVNFDMMFQKAERRWLLFGIAVNTSPAAAALPAAADPSPATKQSTGATGQNN